jgi:hypothetical protein
MERMKRTMALLAALLLPATVLFTACGSELRTGGDSDQQGRTAPTSSPVAAARLSNGYGSARELAEAAVNALSARDTARLTALLIGEDQFNRYLYPEFGMHFPAAQDTSEQARRFIWENHYLGALKGMKRALRELGGVPMALVAVTFTGGTQHYRTYTIHQGTEVRVKLDNGSEADLLALGSVVEMDGRFKLLSFEEQE